MIPKSKLKIIYIFLFLLLFSTQKAKGDFLTVNNLKIYYEHQGKGKNLILIHGFAASSFSYRKNINILAKYFSVYALDLPGFGKSDKPSKNIYSLNFYADILDNFTQKLKIKKTSLAGNSLGGAIALKFTLLYPKKVEKLILFDSAGGEDASNILSLGNSFKNLKEEEIKDNLLSILENKKILTEIMKLVIYDDTLVDEETQKGYLTPLMTEEFAEALIAMLKSNLKIGLKNELPKIKVPVLIVWGEDDLIIPVKNAQTFKNFIPNSKLAILKNTGHISMEENPEQVNKLILEFLK